MAFNYSKLKAAGISKGATRIANLIKDRKPKSVSFSKIKVIKDKMQKPINFSKLTKMSKLPKAKKITLIKKTIKEKKNVGF
jgi:hypothetical protein